METILLVDHDAEVLALAREILQGNGYRILEASSAEEALRTASRYAESIHLLLTAVELPGMSGRDLADQLGRQRPDLKVLYALAFSVVTGRQEFSGAEAGIESGAPVILIPFTSERLTQKVREVLDVRPPSPFSRKDPWKSV